MSPNKNTAPLPDELDDVTASSRLPALPHVDDSAINLAPPATVRELTSTLAESRTVLDDVSSTIVTRPESKPLPPPLAPAAGRRAAWSRRLMLAVAASGAAALVVVINRPGATPQLPTIGDQVIQEGQRLLVPLAALNADALPTLKYELVGAVPPRMELAADTGDLTWQTGESDGPGRQTVRVRAAVAGQPDLASELVFHITVEETPQRPQFSPPPGLNQLEFEDGLYSLRLHARDLDVPLAGELTYAFTAEPPLTGPAHLDPRTGLFTWQPAPAEYGREFKLLFLAGKHPSAMAQARLVVTLPDQHDAIDIGEGLSYRRFLPLLQKQQAGIEPSTAEVPHAGGLLRLHRCQDALLLVIEYANGQAAKHALPEYLRDSELLVPAFVQHAGARRLFHNNRLIALTIGDDPSFVASVRSILGRPQKEL